MFLRKYQDSDYYQVMQLKIHPNQEKYVGTIEEIFDLKTPYSNYILIQEEKQIVGFFNIDTYYSKQYQFTQPNELGFRAFLIDLDFQGKGYCIQAIKLLKPFLKRNFPQHPSVALTVNCKNKTAYHCYQKGGFLDTKKLYYGGQAGPQHIMRMSLSS